jgi:hypothetical protein
MKSEVNMNLRILQVVKTTPKVNNKKTKQNIEPKYTKILNNLLSINSQSDSAIFSKLNFLNQDIAKLFKPEEINNIYTKVDFKIKIKKLSMSSVEKLIKNAATPEDLIKVLSGIDHKPTVLITKQITKDLVAAKKTIIQKISEENTTFLTK